MLTGNGWKAISGQNCMNINQINAYLEGAREIMGERSQTEIAYDDAVVAHLDEIILRPEDVAIRRAQLHRLLRPRWQ